MSKTTKKPVNRTKNKTKTKLVDQNNDININIDDAIYIDELDNIEESPTKPINNKVTKKKIKVIESYGSSDELTEITFEGRDKPDLKKPINAEQQKVVEELDKGVKKRGRGRPRKTDAEKKPPKPRAPKKFDESELDEEELLERRMLMDQYKKYRASFDFKREEIKPETVSNIQIEYEVDQMQLELDSQGGLVCAQVLMMALFSGIEIGSKMVPLGLKLDGLSSAVAKNQKQFDSVLKELMIKYNLFSSSCELRFGMLMVQTVLACHTANSIREKQGEKLDMVDQHKISELQNKYSNL